MDWSDIFFMSFTFVLIAFSLAATGFLFYTYYQQRKAKKSKPTVLFSRNRKKESALIEEILEDIEKHPEDWFIESMMMGDGNYFINDKRNIGILYRFSGQMREAQVVIHLNLKNLSKFEVREDDTIAIEIAGEHVLPFIQKAEQHIDKRGKELDFFKDKLKERL